MKLIVSILVAAVAASHCHWAVAAAKYPSPPIAESIVISEQPLDVHKLLKPAVRVGDTGMYVAQFKGGSATVGILFGPLGMLANTQNILRKSEKLAQGKSGESLAGVVASVKSQLAAKATALPVGSKNSFEVASAVLISFDPDGNVRSSLLIRASQIGVKKPWAKTYFWHFSVVAPAVGLEGDAFNNYLSAVADEMDKAIDQTTTTLLADLAGRFVGGEPTLCDSSFFWPLGPKVRMKFESLVIDRRDDLTVARVDGKPAMLLFTTVDGIHLFQPGQAQFLPPK
jgi:hypothetical protein